MTTTIHPPKISSRLNENVDYLNELLGIGQGPGHSWDIMAKPFGYGNLQMMSYVLNGYFLTMNMVLILQELEKHVLMFQNEHPEQIHNIEELCHYLNKHVGFVQVQMVDKMQDAVRFILSGPLVTFIEGYHQALLIDTRIYPMRSITESEVERVIRGPRDAFVETMLENTALIRRRLREPSLRTELMQIGTRSKTDVTLMYLADISNPQMVDLVRQRLQSIQSETITMAEQAVTDMIIDTKWNPYPSVRYTERPDVAATALVEGHVVIIVDTSPEVIIAPITFWQLVQNPEEYHSYPVVGTYLRWLSIISVLVSIMLPGLFLWVNYAPRHVPHIFHFFIADNNLPLPLWMQLILAEVALDVLRLAVMNAPTQISSMVSIIAALVFGSLAAKIQMLHPEVLVYMSIVLICQFAISSYELATANQMSRYWILACTQIGHLFNASGIGFAVSCVALLIFLATRKSFGIPYFWPVIPWRWRGGLTEILFRRPTSRIQGRPHILKSKLPPNE
ncbi:spore germination protein [Alicyclobacillus sp. TC]|uniref:Stage V sporulation protein AF n=2 Tax=Alicyclobacillus tolerans TaxID=90970 RepID=A0A1M6UXE5_9BACL|nr:MULTISPECIES: spore germination protein [Alicyclobacillus]MDP9729718.1 stage V sporulation protein AF [Alicyclobacillus tengchongensis]QRF22856.1 spore germination protein [Alicyclobacillus sp. TC]SHK73833.1 stage V sporulation protein AF [Alicyclobacillus montanus]